MASMSLFGVLAYFMRERQGVRFLLLVASGRVVWAGRCSSWSPVYTHQSTDASRRISLSMWLARAVMEFGQFGLGPRILQSLSLCLGVACGVNWISVEMLRAQFLVRQLREVF